MRVLPVLTTALLLPVAATGAEFTDLPIPLRGDVHVGYGGNFEQVGIAEPVNSGPEANTDRTFAIRNTVRHDLGMRFEFSPYQGIAVTIGLPITVQQRITFPEAREMLLDGTNGQGSYANGQPIEPGAIETGGLQGAWFGVALAPLHEHYKASLPITTRIDIGVRASGGKSTIYSANRGASPGGPALRLAAAFSSEQGRANPYLSVDFVKEFKGKSDVVDNDGNVWARDLQVKGADRVDLVAGAEIIVAEDEEAASRVAIDLHVDFGYRSWQDQASGFFLPDVLEASRGLTVTQGEYMRAGFGLGVDYHVNRWVGVRIGAQGAYLTPHRIENVYDARTDTGAFDIGWHLNLVGRVRLKGERATL